jgi:uncharacterized short protein YbdD (DUF466 family)
LKAGAKHGNACFVPGLTPIAETIASLPKRVWTWLRAVSGDDAYDRYLEHWRTHHQEDGGKPMSRRAFHRARESERWNGINRCC